MTETDISQHTPMMQAYLKIKQEYPDKLVFYRMGDFYELFFEDAKIAHKVLGITLTQRGKSNNNPIEMAGVPFHALDIYLTKAVNKGHSVVICEQVEAAPNQKGLMTRKVTKIVTPGTAIDSGVLDSKEIKLLAAIYKRTSKTDLSWIDLSTGEIWTHRLDNKEVYNYIQKLNPAEILISEKQLNHFDFPEHIAISKLPEWEFDETLSHNLLSNIFGKEYLYKFGLPDSQISGSIASILNYAKNTQNTEIQHIQNIKWVKNEDFIQLDYNTIKHLDLTETQHTHTLWSILDKCATSMGSRTLKNWIRNPIKNKEILNSRLERVEYLKGNGKPYLVWKNIAQEWCDIERITTKIALKSVRPKELAELRDTLRSIPKLIDWADKMPFHLKGFFAHATPNDSVLKLLEKFIKEDPSTWLRDGDVMADGIDTELDESRAMQQGHDVFLKEFETNEKITTNIANLKVEYNNVQGFFIHVSNSHLTKIPEHYIRKQTLKNGERFTTEELQRYEEKALSARERSLSREKILYSTLLDKLQPYVSILQKQAKILAEWDVLNSFAEMADTQNYTKPEFNNDHEILMHNGRHPVVEITQKDFVPNSLTLNKYQNLSLITGPNMGGKSTIMRQLALLTIMAHIGSFVPATYFSCSTIDAVFTRIGASDDIASGRSTFMVEMSESSYILNNATENSLVLIDELGRGTATYDGLSLAWSIAQYFANNIKSYTLFATHYLELTQLPSLYPNIKNYHVSAIDSGQDLVFTHLLESGPANRSYGIHVAELAGIPPSIIAQSKHKLQELEKDADIKEQLRTTTDDEIEHLDMSNMTPLQAFQWLFEKQKKMKDKK